MRQRGGWHMIPFPESFDELNERTLGGRALGEITTMIAPSSIGKSIFVNEMLLEEIKETDYSIGVISLEADKAEFVEQMNSLNMSVRLVAVPDDEKDWDSIAKSNEIFENRIFMIEDMGALKNQDQFWDKVNFLVNGLGCKTVVFDPATLGVRAARMDEEEFMADLVTFVKKTKVDWINVCHVRKNDNSGQANSEGKDISEEDAKGSGAWIQNSMNNIILMRNKQADNEELKNTTKVKLAKCRRNGPGTGVAGYVLYDVETGRLGIGRPTLDILEEDEGDWEDPSEDFGPVNRFGEGEQGE